MTRLNKMNEKIKEMEGTNKPMLLSRWLVFGGFHFGPRSDAGGADKCPGYVGCGEGVYWAAEYFPLWGFLKSYLESQDFYAWVDDYFKLPIFDNGAFFFFFLQACREQVASEWITGKSVLTFHH